MESLDPEALARLCQQALPDDPRPFELLVTHYKQRVFATAYRLMGNRQDADDLAQEVFLKMYRGIRNLGDPATITSWVYTITTNTCLDALTARQRRPPTTTWAARAKGTGDAFASDAAQATDDPQVPDPRSATPEEEVLQAEVRRCIEEALAGLGPLERAVLVLREMEGRAYQEIAQSLAVGLSAVKMRIHRARVSFGRLLATVCPDVWQRYDPTDRGVPDV